MTAKKKAQKARKAPPRAAPEKKQVLTKPTAMHFTYSPEAGIVRVNVQQDATLMGIRERQGRDLDHQLKDLPPSLQASLEQVFADLANASTATPFKAKK